MAAAAVSAAAFLTGRFVGRLPSTAWDEVDVAVGFFVSLVPVAALVWLVALIPAPMRILTGTLVGAIAAAAGLLWAGGLHAAVPFQVAAAATVGRLVGRQIGDASWLLLVALVALIADAWSVFSGPTRLMVEKAPGVLDYALVHFPALGDPRAGAGLGMSDVVFVALFLVGSHLAGLRARTSFVAMLVSLLLSLGLTLATGRPLPALPLLSLAFMSANADHLWTAAARHWRRLRRRAE